MKKRYKIALGGGAALTGLFLSRVPWNFREDWHVVNKNVIDPDFNCDDLSILGIKLPCGGVEAGFKSVEELAKNHIAEFTIVLATLALLYALLNFRRA